MILPKFDNAYHGPDGLHVTGQEKKHDMVNRSDCAIYRSYYRTFEFVI